MKASVGWHNWLYYEESSPSGLKWKVEIRRGQHFNVVSVAVGDDAGYLDSNGYWTIGLCGQIYKGHRIVWELHNPGLLSEEFIDHKNGDSADNKIENLRKVDRGTNQRNRSKCKSNKSGVTGVSFSHGSGSSSWRAKWHNMDGTRQEKYFSIKKHGNDEAFRLACEYRAKMIQELNEQGAGYTERHGT